MSEQKRFTLRIDHSVYERVERMAEKERRGISKQMELLMEERLDQIEKEQKENR